MNLLVLTVEDRGRKRLSIRFKEASTTDGSTLAPRAFLAIGRAGHAAILASKGVTSSGAKRDLLVFTGENRGRERLGIRFTEAS